MSFRRAPKKSGVKKAPMKEQNSLYNKMKIGQSNTGWSKGRGLVFKISIKIHFY